MAQVSNQVSSLASTPSSKVQRNFSQKVVSLNSKTIGKDSQKFSSAERKAESSGAGAGQDQKRLQKSKSPNLSLQKDRNSDTDQGEEPNQPSKEEKIVK